MATANFKVSAGVVPGQHVYTGELVLGHTHTHAHSAQSGLISGPSELREAFNQGQLTALGIFLIPLSLTHSPVTHRSRLG